MVMRSKKEVESGVFLLHDTEDWQARDAALRLKEGLQLLQKTSCCLEVPAFEMEEFLTPIRSAKFVLLIQTRHVLSRPYVLVATYYAALAHVPIVCVVVDGAGYDFGDAAVHLHQLALRLNEADVGQMCRALGSWTPPKELSAMAFMLSKQIPAIISVVYNPNGTHNALAATLRDIADKQALLKAGNRKHMFQPFQQTSRRSFTGTCDAAYRVADGFGHGASSALAPVIQNAVRRVGAKKILGGGRKLAGSGRKLAVDIGAGVTAGVTGRGQSFRTPSSRRTDSSDGLKREVSMEISVTESVGYAAEQMPSLMKWRERATSGLRAAVSFERRTSSSWV